MSAIVVMVAQSSQPTSDIRPEGVPPNRWLSDGCSRARSAMGCHGMLEHQHDLEAVRIETTQPYARISRLSHADRRVPRQPKRLDILTRQVGKTTSLCAALTSGRPFLSPAV